MHDTLREMFRHNAWATKAVISACGGLSAEQLKRPARGFGSILATLNHVVLSDAGYAAILVGDAPGWVTGPSDTQDLALLAARVDETARRWDRLLSQPFDAAQTLVLDQGEYQCAAAVVLVQAIHHANAHREQVRAGLKELGLSPPDVQAWAYALAGGQARWCGEHEAGSSGA